MAGPSRWIYLLPMLIVVIGTGTFAASSPGDKVISSIDLSKPFHTRPAWHFTATQGPPGKDVTGYDDEPGVITICLKEGSSSKCGPSLRTRFDAKTCLDPFPQYLNSAEIVHPHDLGGRAMLLVQLATAHSGDGDQCVLTQALAYDPSRDQFRSLYQFSSLAGTTMTKCAIFPPVLSKARSSPLSRPKMRPLAIG